MARVTCRCGETLNVTKSDPDRVKCPRCGAKIRVRRDPSQRPGGAAEDDGFVRFNCACGRRLKVRSDEHAEFGKCPDCGRVVPVPETAAAAAQQASPGPRGQRRLHPNAHTDDMDAADFERLDLWAKRCAGGDKAQPREGGDSTVSLPSMGTFSAAPTDLPGPSPGVNSEAGLRVCPGCGKALHMSATVCRSCGEPVPKH